MGSTHRWDTEEEYAAQIALPVHRQKVKPSFDEGGAFWETACGLRLNGEYETPVRSTDDRKAVTCGRCRRKR